MKKRLRASTVVQAEGRLLLVRLRDPSSGVEALFPPGGGVEEGERPAETARRETLEETGLRVRVEPKTELVDTYPFTWDGVDYEVTTHYFAAALEEPFDAKLPEVKDASYNLGARWLPAGEALEALAVHPRIARAVSRVAGRANRLRWQKHPNAGGPAGTLLMIHGHFRTASERLLHLLAEGEELGWMARAFLPLAETLHHHHHAEEMMLFPMIEERTGEAPERLVSDHEELTEAIESLRAALSTSPNVEGARARAADAVHRFDAVLIDHLDREEAQVIPVLLQLSPAEAWSLMHG